MTDRNAVTQEDREAAIKTLAMIFGNGHSATYALARTDRHFLFDEFARHRLAAEQATRAKVVEEICAAAFSLAATHYDNGNEGDSEVLSEFACYVRDQFTPPQTKD